jgi:hypothetical protein
MRKQREVPDKLYLGQLPSMTKLYPVSVQIEKVFFDIYVTEFGADLTTVLPVLFKYCCKYWYYNIIYVINDCFSISPSHIQ